MFNKIWNNILRFNWIFGSVLILTLGIPRFILVLEANVTGKFNYVSIVFIIMWILPFTFLSKKGRKNIGFVKTKNKKWLIYALLIGATASFITYFVGLLLFRNSYQNWFVYLAKPFEIFGDLNSSNRLIALMISAIIAMTFSPIGEEIFYRGMVHASFKENIGDTRASYVDSLAFALTHLAHFGIVFINDHWKFLLIPSIFWIGLMFLASRLFFLCKKKSGSLLGAIICHSSFNLVMMYIIFYRII